MEETSKIFMLPDNKNNTAETMALMNGGCNNWMNNPFMYLIWLAFFGGNGFGWGNKNTQNTGLQDQITQLQQSVNDNHNNDLAMQAIQGNGAAIHELANNLNISVGALSTAIANVTTAVGMSGKDIVNSILLGNKDLIQQIANCCCENKQLVTQMGYEGQLRDQTNTSSIINKVNDVVSNIQQGFSSTAYETQAQTNALSRDLQNQTQTIIDKISNMEANAQQDKINTLTAQLTAANSRAERAAELQPILAELNAIRCAQPSTVAVQYPQLTAYPSYLNTAAYNGYGNNSFWG